MSVERNLESPFVKPNSARLARGGAALMGILILIQAFLGGRGFFLDADLLKVHRAIGMAAFVVAASQIWVVMMSIREGRDRSMLLGMSGLILILTTIQLGLGFSAKDSGESASWHIFNGVFLTGAIAAYANTVFSRLLKN
jgi:hypothetical protein